MAKQFPSESVSQNSLWLLLKRDNYQLVIVIWRSRDSEHSLQCLWSKDSCYVSRVEHKGGVTDFSLGQNPLYYTAGINTVMDLKVVRRGETQGTRDHNKTVRCEVPPRVSFVEVHISGPQNLQQNPQALWALWRWWRGEQEQEQELGPGSVAAAAGVLVQHQGLQQQSPELRQVHSSYSCIQS